MRTWSMWAVALALVCAGCGKDKNNEGGGDACTVPADCDSGQTCEAGVCVADTTPEPECNGDPDCPGGFECNEGVCEQIPLDMGDPDPVDMGSNNGEPDMNFDNIPPQVVSITPAHDTVDVEANSTVVVVFNEAMRENSINLQSIEIRDAANRAVPSAVTYDAATFTATLTPQAPLREASPYRVVVTTFVRDAADNALPEEEEAKFYTVFAEPAGLRAVAEKWAPHIYQAVGDASGGSVNVDLPTRVDFDANLKARDNKSKARLGSTRNRASVYYSVVETKTHYFVMYSMYYPIRVVAGTDHEHDFTGAVLVVDKASDALVLVDGVKAQASGTDTNLGFIPDTSTVNAVGSQQVRSFPAASLEDGTHYPMFVPAGEHEACAFPIDGNPPYCSHNAGEFPTDAGILLKPGAMGQTYMQAVDATAPLYPNDGRTYKEMTYELIPLPASLWARRTDVGSELLWQATQVYSPLGMDRPATTSQGSPIIVPTTLVSDDAMSYGKPPFQWLRTSAESNSGQWLFDPAYLLLNKYEFGETWSQEYCYNIFLDVNLRGNAAHPECGSD